MKKILLPLALMAVMAGCSDKNGPVTTDPDEPVTEEAVAISLGSGVKVQTKAPIVSGDMVYAQIAGWESAKDDATVSTDPAGELFNVLPTWVDSIEFTAQTTPQPVTWTGGTPQYYPADGDSTYMRAWHPYDKDGVLRTDDDGKVVAEFDNNGTVDVLLLKADDAGRSYVVGNKLNAGEKQLDFEHLSTQIKFVGVAGEGMSADILDIESITIHDAATITGVNLTDNVGIASAESDLAVPAEAESADEKNTFIMMIAPRTGLTIDIVANGVTYENQLITIEQDGGTTDQSLKAGRAYEVTLTFVREEIKATATVASWIPAGNSGIELD